jgi:hypothetical protein
MGVPADNPVVIAAEDPTSSDAQRCLQAYFAELKRMRVARDHGATSARLETGSD